MSEQSNPKQSQPDSPRDRVAAEFASQAEQASPGMIVEFIDFLKDNKKWWLLPILVVLLLFGLLLVLTSTAAAPFIYTLF